MGTIFVAYGDPGHREAVLSFAAERAAAAGDDLLVYHVQETTDDPVDDIEAEVATLLERTAPDVAFEVRVETKEEYSDRTNVSVHRRLVDAVLDSEREYEYVVMGNRERSALSDFSVGSSTRAVLETRSVPVVLVPA